MMQFYRNLMRFDSEVNDCNRIIRFKNPSIVIQLERVENSEEHEVIGSLEFLSTEEKLHEFLHQRKEEKFELQSNNGHLELTIDDPDENTISLVSEAISEAA